MIRGIENFIVKISASIGLSVPEKNMYYEHLLEKYNSADPYLSLIAKTTELACCETLSEISFSPTLKFSSSSESLLINFKKKNFVCSQKTELHTEVFLYKMLIGKHKVRIELHFFNNSLFYYKYFFSRVNEIEKLELLSLLYNKYLNKDVHQHVELIRDTRANYIYIDSSVGFTLNYFNASHRFFSLIHQQAIDNVRAIEQRNKSKVKELYSRL